MKPDNKIYRALRLGVIQFFSGKDENLSMNGFVVSDFDKVMHYLEDMYVDSVKYSDLMSEDN